jgi:hypothetical protein
MDDKTRQPEKTRQVTRPESIPRRLLAYRGKEIQTERIIRTSRYFQIHPDLLPDDDD